METTQERNLEVILNWPRSWFVKAPPDGGGTRKEFWLPKKDATRLGNVDWRYSTFAIRTEAIKKMGI